MRTSREILEELLSGLEKKNLDDLKKDSQVLKNYGVLSYEDYKAVRGRIISERKFRKEEECKCEVRACGK